MSFFGNALAAYLVKFQGLYSVQLPEALRPTLIKLASDLNPPGQRRGIYVTDFAMPGSVLTSRWAEVLKWRTADDRVFVWERGAGEPDSSFQSAVQEFIGPRFPVDGSICDLNTLATLVVRRLFDTRSLNPSGAFFDAFAGTTMWVAEAYVQLFQEIGSSTASHWSDQFLIDWTEFCDQLPGLINQAVIHGLQPRFAWEIVRAAGMIVPTLEPGNPFGNAPTAIPLPKGKKLEQYGQTWQAVVAEFLSSSAHRSVLLNELDRRVQGAGTRTPWRDLSWTVLDSVQPNRSAGAVGRRVFLESPSLAVIGPQPPAYPAAPLGAWWGVTQEDLEAAVVQIRQERPLQPPGSSQAIVQPFQGAELYLLATRNGNVAYTSTPRKWRCVVTCSGITLEYRGRWKSLTVADDQPTAASEGDAWVQPSRVVAKTNGKGVAVSVSSIESIGGLLRVHCSISIEYSGSIDPASAFVTCAWEPRRRLTLTLQIRDHANGVFGAAREDQSQMDLIVPSALAPTIIVTNDVETVVSPGSGDEFVRDGSAAESTPISTPEVRLAEERLYEVGVYDGTVRVGLGEFVDPATASVDDLMLAPDPNIVGLCSGSTSLTDGSTIGREGRDLAAVRILEEPPAAVSSGIVAALQGRPATRRPPSAAAAGSLLGHHQTRIVRGLCTQLASLPFQSLLHTVVASGAEVAVWPDSHPAQRQPLFVGMAPAAFPGIGSGADKVFDTAEWSAFSKALERVCQAIGLTPTSHDVWLSGFDPSAVPSPIVREYNRAHAALIDAAATISTVEVFWVSYPLSVFVVNSRPGRHFGQLEAILLSPLHPVRLSWAHSVATFARHADAQATGSRELIGLAEGWNLPLVGYAPSATGRQRPLVAVPIDPGSERDFIQWSALAVLMDGLVEAPAEATGLPLPWAGRSGINDKVVERALQHYLSVSPYLGSVVVDLRSVEQAPRSAEIDHAVLEFLTDTSNAAVAALPGGGRVWDSSYREGAPPSRDELIVLRDKMPDSEVTFEWRAYNVPDIPAHSDVAFVENAGVSLDVVEGTTQGLLGALPLRRLLPADNLVGHMDQNFTPAADEDVIALAPLLRRLESPKDGRDALRASPSIQTLGIAQGGKWEIIGTFNLSPRLLALTLSSASGGGSRLLWEWRPSWLNPERQGYVDLARRPYYVVARIPASLTVGLATRQLIPAERIELMISELGRRAVGLATLYAAGDKHENAAAGFYDALQLITPANVSTPAAWIRPAPWIQSVVPIDPLADLLGAVAGKKFQQRSDLLTVGCHRDDKGTHICLTPIEVKHHGTPADPEAPPGNSHPELNRAREQLKQTDEILQAIREVFTVSEGNAIVALGRRLGLAVMLDFALDFTIDSLAASTRGAILGDVLAGGCSVSIGTSCLLWFAPGSMSHTGASVIRNTHSAGDFKVEEAYVDPYAIPGLLWPGQPVGPNEEFARASIDELLTTAVSQCASLGPSSVDLRSSLKVLLKIDGDGVEPLAESVQNAPPVSPPLPTTVPTALPTSEVQAVVTASEPIDPPGPALTSEVHEAGTGKPTAIAPAPQLVVGSRQVGARWTVLGKMATGAQESVALDLDHPKVLGIFGYMGSGKSYLLGAVTEAAVQAIPNLNALAAPLAVVVFNYRRNASDRFELSSLRAPNANADDVRRLAAEFSARPTGVSDVHALTLRGELTVGRLAEYGGMTAHQLLFRPSSLHVEDWELLMGEPGPNRLYSQLIRHALIQLREQGDVSVAALRSQIQAFPNPGSRNAADQRLTFAERHLSDVAGINFSEVVQPGRVLVIDLRQPLFSRDDALRFFLVCANQISRVQGQFNKMVIFDEAHEYLSDSFGEKLDSRIRLSRHEGTSYVFATQDVGSIPKEIQRFVSTKCVFGLGSHQNVKDLLEFAPEFKGLELVELPPGQCFVQSTSSHRNMFSQPRLVKVRPRASAHGGGSRIFS